MHITNLATFALFEAYSFTEYATDDATSAEARVRTNLETETVLILTAKNATRGATDAATEATVRRIQHAAEEL